VRPSCAECVGTPVSISVSPNSLVVGNPNRSCSEFDSCLPDLVLQVCAAAAHNEHGMDTSIMPRLAKNHWPLALHNSEPHCCLIELHTLLKYFSSQTASQRLTLNPPSNVAN
jgi:hypothetical protein